MLFDAIAKRVCRQLGRATAAYILSNRILVVRTPEENDLRAVLLLRGLNDRDAAALDVPLAPNLVEIVHRRLGDHPVPRRARGDVGVAIAVDPALYRAEERRQQGELHGERADV